MFFRDFTWIQDFFRSLFSPCKISVLGISYPSWRHFYCRFQNTFLSSEPLAKFKAESRKPERIFSKALRIISSLYCTIIPARLMSAALQPKAVGRGKNLP
jgi:hypothetical protein